MQGTVSLRSVHGKFLSAQPDGIAQWNRDVASLWEYFYLEKRQGGKITLKGAHGMYVSAQPDGSVQINRKTAPQGGWEEFTIEDRGNNVVCLKSCHGKYLSAQQDGTAQWNRDYAPPGGWEDIQFVQQGDIGQGPVHAPESIEILEDTPDKPAQMTEESTKNAAKIGFVVGITLLTMGLPLLIIGSISTAEDRLAMIIPGAILMCVGGFTLFMSISALIRMGSTEGRSSVMTTEVGGNDSTSIEVLSFNHNQPIRFKINNPPPGNNAWVGIYRVDAEDREHDDCWQWLRDIDVENATLPGQSKGKWSIRLFSDGGYTLHERTDFEILEGHKNEVWMRNARIEDSRIIGDMINHPTFGNMNRRTSTIVTRSKHGNLHRFDTNNTIYLIKDEELADDVNINEPFWEND